MNLKITTLAFLLLTSASAMANDDFITELNKYLEPQITPGKVVAEQQLPQFNSSVATLSNGIKLYLHPTKAKPGRVAVMAVSNGGFAQNYDPAKKGLYKASEDIVDLLDYGPFDGDSIKSFLKREGMKSSVNIDKQIEEMSASGPSDKLPVMLSLLYLKATAMKPNAERIDSYLSKKSRYVRNVANSPILAMADSIHSVVYRRHPLGEKLHYAEFPSITPEAMSALYNERFGDMSDFNFIISGDFDPTTAKSLAEKYIASLPSAGRMEKSKEIGFGYPQQNDTLSYSYEMQKPMAITYSFRNGDCQYTLPNILKAQIFGLVLSTRLNKELRHNRGIINHIKTHCSVTCGFNGDTTPAQFIMPTYIRCTPGKEAEVHQAVKAEIENIAGNGVTDEELNKIKDSLLKAHADHLNQNNYWNTVLRVYALYGCDMNSGFEDIMNGIDSGSISGFANKYIIPATTTIMTMSPKEKES